ncbi:MAG: NERD domain-containing protein [Flavobacteriaceae bacterium]|nr:NERD domain-containing protein [Flavobacteriaceae bacterium]
MDTQILLFVIILIAFGIHFYFKRVLIPKIKGGFGEQKVALRLNWLDKRNYIILNDVLLKFGESTTQIDHIVISKSGLFVIETKNFDGWIHGHENSEYWKQTIYSQKFRFKNPIKQNELHVYALKRILIDYPRIRYFPIVVFCGGAVLKNVTNWSPVIYCNKIIRTIKSMDNEFNLTEEQMQKISDYLNRVRLRGFKENRNHVKRIKNKRRGYLNNSTSITCPNCGDYLVKKTGKYGVFYGCSNYPACRYTENVKN